MIQYDVLTFNTVNTLEDLIRSDDLICDTRHYRCGVAFGVHPASMYAESEVAAIDSLLARPEGFDASFEN
jgi:hypothetical protein